MSNEFGPGHYDTTQEVSSRPTPIATEKPGDRWFGPCDVNGNGGTQINAMFLNMIIAELRNSARSAGAASGELNENKLAEAMARYASGGRYCTCTGPANAYVLAISAQFVAPKSYFAGMMLLWRPSAANTGAATANAFGLGAKSIIREDGTPLQANDIGGRHVLTMYDPSANSGSGAHVLMEFTRGTSSSSSPAGILAMQVLDTPGAGTYTPSIGAKKALVFATGAGASGHSNGNATGVGGGAGGTAISLVDLTGIESVAVQIGIGGAPAPNSYGNDGGDTSFGAHAVGPGGKKGTPGKGGLGGVPTVGQMKLVGGSGAASNDFGGHGGQSFLGAGAPSVDGNPLGSPRNGENAPGYGGGGGGADGINSSSMLGGSGGNGVIWVIEFA